MNTDLAQADIFFYISSIGFVVLGVLATAVLIYAISLLHDLKNIFRTVKKQTDLIVEDIEHLRHKAREEGVKFGRIVSFITSLFFSQKKKGKNHEKNQ